MKEKIFHGIPQLNYFAIALPVSWLKKSIDTKEDTVILIDPKTDVENRCQIVDMWTFDLNDFSIMDGFSLLTYGIPAAKMVNILKIKYPEIQDNNVVRFILLKRL